MAINLNKIRTSCSLPGGFSQTKSNLDVLHSECDAFVYTLMTLEEEKSGAFQALLISKHILLRGGYNTVHISQACSLPNVQDYQTHGGTRFAGA